MIGVVSIFSPSNSGKIYVADPLSEIQSFSAVNPVDGVRSFLSLITIPDQAGFPRYDFTMPNENESHRFFPETSRLWWEGRFSSAKAGVL
ncbi:MAG: hypothetical protein ACOYOS_18950 [Syntrophales bacterium]